MKLITLILTAVLCLSSCTASAAAAVKGAPERPKVIQVTFRSAVSPESLHMFEIGWSQVIKKNPQSILLVIDSTGGDVESGWAIVKLIQTASRPVHCIVDGQASSIAFVILQSCTTRGITPLSTVMAHEPRSMLGVPEGSKYVTLRMTDMRNLLLDLQAAAERMAIFCSTRIGMPLADFEKEIANVEWVMGSATALKKKTVDYVSSVAEARAKLDSWPLN